MPLPSASAPRVGEPPEPLEPGDWPWRSERYAWWVVVVLAGSLTLSIADRMILALMIEPIKSDLQLSDTEIGLVQGVAFALFYVAFSLPMGRLADRGSRRALAAMSVVGWSAMTAACGLAKGFTSLFIFRAGVGVGEAGLSPAAISLISDYFPKDRRARPMAVMSIGAAAGSGLGLMFGGAVIAIASSEGGIPLPGLGVLRPWQIVFLLLGVFGIIFSLLFLTVNEPKRQETAALLREDAVDLLPFLRHKQHVLAPYFIGNALTMLVLVGYHSWVPSFMIREHAWSAQKVAFTYGAIVAAAGVIGTLGAGFLADRLIRAGRSDGALRVGRLAAMLAILPLAVSTLLSEPTAILTCLFIGITLLTMLPALAPAVVQAQCPNELRGQVYGLYVIILSILGYALGPLIVALITDLLVKNDAGLGLSLCLTSSVFVPISAWLIHRAQRALAQ